MSDALTVRSAIETPQLTAWHCHCCSACLLPDKLFTDLDPY